MVPVYEYVFVEIVVYLFIRSFVAPLQKECFEAPQSGDVVTILALSKEKLDMHVKHETNLKAMLSQLSTESSKQSNVSGRINCQ